MLVTGTVKAFFDSTYQLPNLHRVEKFEQWIK